MSPFSRSSPKFKPKAKAGPTPPSLVIIITARKYSSKFRQKKKKNRSTKFVRFQRGKFPWKSLRKSNRLALVSSSRSLLLEKAFFFFGEFSLIFVDFQRFRWDRSCGIRFDRARDRNRRSLMLRNLHRLLGGQISSFFPSIFLQKNNEVLVVIKFK